MSLLCPDSVEVAFFLGDSSRFDPLQRLFFLITGLYTPLPIFFRI